MSGTVVISGNLATPLRTVAGVLGELRLVEATDGQAAAILADAGLPLAALNQPDFPISLDQELRACAGIVSLLPESVSPISLVAQSQDSLSLEFFGVLGMTMRHADTVLHALALSMEFPQLTWGHCRLLVLQHEDSFEQRLELDLDPLPVASAGQSDRLRQFCIMLDLVSMLCITRDLIGAAGNPLRVTLPWPQPDDWPAEALGCPVQFETDNAAIFFSPALAETALPRANDMLYRNYYLIAERLSRMLAEDRSLAEQVTRWLWAQTPVLKRAEIARLLALSERTLTRRLKAEGTSYAALLARVQNQRAQGFLRNPALSVTQVAERLGYAEPAAFSRAFTGWNGESPLKWRQRLGLST